MVSTAPGTRNRTARAVISPQQFWNSARRTERYLLGDLGQIRAVIFVALCMGLRRSSARAQIAGAAPSTERTSR